MMIEDIHERTHLRAWGKPFCWISGILIMLLISLSLATAVSAHGPIHEQIERIDRRLAEEGENAELYFRRGRLFIIHEDWDAALRDFDRVEKLDAGLLTVDIFRAEALIGKKQFKAAMDRLEAYIGRKKADTTEGNLARAFFLRAKIYEQQARPLEAAESFGRSIALLKRPTPDHYLARARALAKAGEDHLQAAIEALDEGNDKLGSLAVLEREALKYEVKIQSYDQALTRLDRLIEQSRRRESWLVERGRILVAAGRVPEARAAFEEAQIALGALPPHRRGTRAMVALASEIRDQLEHLSTLEASPEGP